MNIENKVPDNSKAVLAQLELELFDSYANCKNEVIKASIKLVIERIQVLKREVK